MRTRNSPRGPRIQSAEDRFWRKVAKSDGCWEWQGSRTSFGYGKCQVANRFWMAHRFAWHVTHGPIPKTICVLHHCDNPPCVRPDHLFLGTHVDNQRDMYEKGRARDRWGRPKHRREVRDSVYGPRLTSEQVAAIHSRPKTHGSLKRVADELGINYMRAWRVASGRCYRKVAA